MPWRREWLPTPVFLPEHPMDRGARRAAVHAVSRVGHDWATKLPPPLQTSPWYCRTLELSIKIHEKCFTNQIYQFTYFECTVQWVLTNANRSATATTTNKIFSHPQNFPHDSLPNRPLYQPYPEICFLSFFARSRVFYKLNHAIHALPSDFFLSSSWFWDLPSLRVPVAWSLSLLSSAPLYGYTTLCSFILNLVDV